MPKSRMDKRYLFSKGLWILCLIAGFVVFMYTLFVMFKEFDRQITFPVHTKRQVMRKSTLAISRENQSNEINMNTCIGEKFKNVLLIIAFGAMNELESIPLFELLYKQSFPHRVYCGPDYPSNKTEEFGFIKLNTRYGAFLYDCLTEVLKQSEHLKYKGYIFVGEDTLLNFWNIVQLDFNRIWESDLVISGPDLYREITNDIEWWPSPWGVQAIEKLYEYFAELSYYDGRKSKLTDDNWTPEWDANLALNKWLWNGGGLFRTYWSSSSFLYLPKTFVDLYLNITKHVRKSGIRNGMSLPLVSRLLVLEKNIEKLPTILVDRGLKSHILVNRDILHRLSRDFPLIHVNGTRKERREFLSELRLKEYAIGTFLRYSHC